MARRRRRAFSRVVSAAGGLKFDILQRDSGEDIFHKRWRMVRPGTRVKIAVSRRFLGYGTTVKVVIVQYEACCVKGRESDREDELGQQRECSRE